MTARRKSLLIVLGVLVVVGLAAWPTCGYLRGLYHARAAREALDRRDLPSARDHLRQYLSQFPTDPDMLLLAAQAARRDGDVDAGWELLRSALKANAAFEKVEQEDRLFSIQSGDLRDAEALLKSCAENPTDFRNALTLEALILGSLHLMHLHLAQRGVALWLDQYPSATDQAQGLVWRGDLALRQGDSDAALGDYREALGRDPSFTAARRKAVEILVRYDPKEALDHLTLLRRDRPDDSGLNLLLARCRRALGDHEEAVRLLDELMAREPDNVAVLLERGQTVLDLGRRDEAERCFRRAVELAPQRRDPNLALARCLQQAGKDVEAQVYQERVAKIDAELNERINQLFTPKQSPP